MRTSTARGNDSSEDTVVERDVRTILSRYEDNTTAPHDALKSLQIVNNAKMTVHYHFHDHQHTVESEASATAVKEDTDQQQPVAHIDNSSSFEQLEQGEIREGTPFLAQNTGGSSTGVAKRLFSETGTSDTQAYPPPAKRIKEQDSCPSNTEAAMSIHEVQARLTTLQDQNAPGEPVQVSAPQSETVRVCRHCKSRFTDKENNKSACGVHKGRYFQSNRNKLTQTLTTCYRTKGLLQMGRC